MHELLTQREVEATKSLIGITTDKKLKRILEKRLREHEIAFELREIQRAIYRRREEMIRDHREEILNRS